MTVRTDRGNSPAAIEDACPLTGYQAAALLRAATRPAPPDPAVRIGVEAPDRGTGPLRAALARLVRGHPALRTVIDATGAGGPVQLVLREAEPVVEVVDLTDRTAEDAERAVARWRAADPRPDRPDPVRLTAHRLPGGRQLLHLDLADPVLDPVGAERVGADLVALCHGAEPVVPPSAATRDAVAAEQQGEPAPGTAVLPGGGPATAGTTLDAELTAALRAAGPPLHRLLLAAFLATVGRHSGTRHVAAWSVRRVGEGTGEFRRLEPVTVDRAARSWADLVDRIAPRAHPGTDAPVFEWRELGGEAEVETPGEDLVATVSPAGLTLRSTRDAAFLADCVDTLRRMAADPGTAPQPSPLPEAHGTGGARDHADPDGPGEPGDHDGRTVPELIARVAAARPDAVAVVDEDGGETSYRALLDRAAGIAAGLVAAGIPAGSVVGLHLPRSAELVAAMLGVLSTGSAFLALDPDYPAERSAAALADSGAAVLLIGTATAARPDHAGPVLALDGMRGGRSVELPPVPAESAAYVLFTSGSTGRPKGVAVPHRALASLMHWSATGLGLRPGDRIAQRTPVAFDAGMWEVFGPLAAGAALVVTPSRANREPAVLAEALRRHRISVLQLVPALLAAHLEARTLGALPELRMVLCGGEALHRPLAEEFAASCPQARLLNVYGPTECAVDAVWAVADPHEAADTVPIGRPVPGVVAHVLDELGEPAAAMAPGELVLGGPQLALGYHRRAGDTAARFLPDHLGGRPGARLYRTGDLVRRLPDGQLEYLGRIDRQVKVRGVRTEPGEIEAVLVRHPAIREAAVVAAPDHDGGMVLHAFLVADERSFPPGGARAALREHAARWLPDTMVPTAFVLEDRLPVLPNGKTDLTALAARAGRPPVAAYRAPSGPDERWLTAQWTEVLALDAVGRDDELGPLGAGPVAAARVAARIHRERGVRVTVPELLGAATVARQSVLLTGTVRSG
ncbi:amino acid adenylation domain-containing protein [Streptomyces sp. NPDC059604]|uniref:amino acid adenylation domain-containing protein n=1 Tax=Streptomyces sp. NPDC059604 TaxID=3346881 RepID=UPI0036C87F4F